LVILVNDKDENFKRDLHLKIQLDEGQVFCEACRKNVSDALDCLCRNLGLVDNMVSPGQTWPM
jgi:hypothetical protein